MIVLAIYTINFFHPGRLLGPSDTWLMDHKALFSRHGKNTAGSTTLDDSSAADDANAPRHPEIDAEKANAKAE